MFCIDLMGIKLCLEQENYGIMLIMSFWLNLLSSSLEILVASNADYPPFDEKLLV